MRRELAIGLISDLMEWSGSEATKEYAWLKLMVDYKFDRYQGYGPGIHFYVRLISWLTQFNNVEARRTAYRFLRNHLIFVGQPELHQLIKLAMPEMEKDARRIVASRLNIPYYKSWTNEKAKRDIQLMSLRTLYVGLSDGARIDVFRRDNDGLLTNEQVVASSEISEPKWESLEGKLDDRLRQKGFPEEERKFERVCLIDDFTGSGTTLLRQKHGRWDGKVHKFCEQNKERKQLADHCHLQIHHYLASSKASKMIDEALTKFQKATPKFGCKASYSWVLSAEPDVVMGAGSDVDIVRWISDHYDPSIQTSHNCADGQSIALGYKQCGLTVVLEHNTPNNTVALVWATSKSDSKSSHFMRPLFPRIERHIDNGQSV